MKEITTQELTERLVAGETLRVVDIREADEFHDWHIHGAENVPVYAAIATGDESRLRERLQQITGGAPVVAVCRTGQTSLVAAGILTSMGVEAASLQGGIRGWSNAWTSAVVPSRTDGLALAQIRRNGKGCLSYLVTSNGEAAVVDPCLGEDVYRRAAESAGCNIKYIVETHVHADHISRARDLAAASGAALCMPKNDRVQFEYTELSDDQTLSLGNTTMRVISTPGHTGESACLLIADEVLLSGDTLFTENIGRPDLEKGDAGAVDGAKQLFASLHNRILKLAPELTVCPGHTSEPIGFDGRPIAGRLGTIVESIDLLKIDEAEFVKQIPEMLGQKPPNFQRVLAVNEGRAQLGWLDPLELEAGPNRCAVGKN